MSTSTTGVDDSLWNTLVIKSMDHKDVLEKFDTVKDVGIIIFPD